MAIPTLFWTGEPLRDDMGGDRNVYLDDVEHDHNHIDDGHHYGPYRHKREAVKKSQMSPRVPDESQSPRVPDVLMKRGLEALTWLLKIKSAPEDDEKAEGRADQLQRRMLSPAMLQDWDIGETIRAMVCPQCLLEGFVFGSMFVSCDCMPFESDIQGDPSGGQPGLG